MKITKTFFRNHLLKVNRKSMKLPKCAPASPCRARKSNRSISNLQFNSILKFTGKQKIRKGSERRPQFEDKSNIETHVRPKNSKGLAAWVLPHPTPVPYLDSPSSPLIHRQISDDVCALDFEPQLTFLVLRARSQNGMVTR